MDLHFKINDSIAREIRNYSIQVLAKSSSDHEFDKHIFVYRIDMRTIGEVFVTLFGSTHDLHVVICKKKKKKLTQCK